MVLNDQIGTFTGNFISGTKTVSMSGNGNGSLSLAVANYFVLSVYAYERSDAVCVPYKTDSTNWGVHCTTDSGSVISSGSVKVKYFAYKYA